MDNLVSKFYICRGIRNKFLIKLGVQNSPHCARKTPRLPSGFRNGFVDLLYRVAVIFLGIKLILIYLHKFVVLFICPVSPFCVLS